MNGQLWIVASPSGGGKTSLISEMTATLDNVVESISLTTRARRPGEQDGVHYHFVEQKTFDALAQKGDFLEWAQVFNYAYATSGEHVDALLFEGKDVILSIDWQGAEQVMRLRPNTKSVFILPPSLNALRERLTRRGQDDPDVVDKRMLEASEQISHYVHFDYVIVNDDFPRAANELRCLLRAARLERQRQEQDLQPLLNALGAN